MLWSCILLSRDETPVEWNLVSTIIGKPWSLTPPINMIVTDIVPTFLAFGCTALVIHMNGYVGVLDLENMQELLVVKRKGGTVRTQLEQAIYELDGADSDRVLGGSSSRKTKINRNISNIFK